MASSDAEIVAVFTNETNGAAYVTYFGDVLNDIETRVATVRDAWESGYRDTFVANGGIHRYASSNHARGVFLS